MRKKKKKKGAHQNLHCAAMKPEFSVYFSFPKAKFCSFLLPWSQCAYMSPSSLHCSLNLCATLDNLHNIFLPK